MKNAIKSWIPTSCLFVKKKTKNGTKTAVFMYCMCEWAQQASLEGCLMQILDKQVHLINLISFLFFYVFGAPASIPPRSMVWHTVKEVTLKKT